MMLSKALSLPEDKVGGKQNTLPDESGASCCAVLR